LTDSEGRLQGANPRFFQMLSPTFPRAGQLLADCFTSLSASVLESVFQQTATGNGGMGSCLLHLTPRADNHSVLEARWLRVVLPTGPVFLFAFAEDWRNLDWNSGALLLRDHRFLAAPSLSAAAGWLALLLRPDGEVDFWNERWEKLTGIAGREITGASG